MPEIKSEKNKPIRVTIVGGSGENVDLELLTNRDGDHFHSFVTSNLPEEIEIISINLPINKNFNIQGYFVSGTVPLAYTLLVNDTEKGGGWVTTYNPQSPSFNFSDGSIKALSGENIKVLIKHENIDGGIFRASLWGYYDSITI